jgi:hypothetical protein
MIEHNAQQSGTNPARVKSNTPEMGSELVEEADQRSREMLIQRELCKERIRLVIIGIALLAMILSFLLWLFTRAVLPLFVAIVVSFLGYRQVDAWFDRLNETIV